jgi:hypothetical protein
VQNTALKGSTEHSSRGATALEGKCSAEHSPERLAQCPRRAVQSIALKGAVQSPRRVVQSNRERSGSVEQAGTQETVFGLQDNYYRVKLQHNLENYEKYEIFEHIFGQIWQIEVKNLCFCN